MSALEAEIQRLTGKIEEQSFKIQKLEGELNRRLSDAELRLSDLEQAPSGGGVSDTSVSVPTNNAPYQAPVPTQNVLSPGGSAEPSSGSNQASWKSPQPALSGNNVLSGTPSTTMYEKAFATMRNGDYNTAEVQFKEFLNSYPTDGLANNARYWLAETYYVRNKYQEASQGFAQAYQNDPQGQKAPDNLLKLGLSLAGLGKNEDACVAIGQLLKEYDAAARSVISRGEREAQRLGCAL